MFGFLSKIFGGSKSEKDTKKLQPVIEKVNSFFNEYQSLSNDELRHKTQEFRQRIKERLSKIDEEINTLNANADALSHEALFEKDNIYKQVDELKKIAIRKLKRCLRR